MVGTQLMVCQAFAVLEVIHPLVGLVKTGVMSPLMQVKFISNVTFLLCAKMKMSYMLVERS